MRTAVLLSLLCSASLSSWVNYTYSSQFYGATATFGARGDTPATIAIPSDASTPIALYLTYVSGGVTCGTGSTSHWGCYITAADKIWMSVTNGTDPSPIAPPTDGSEGVEWYQFQSQTSHWARSGNDWNSLVLTIPFGKGTVLSGTELRVWYSEDLSNYVETDNSGSTTFSWSLLYGVECGNKMCTHSESHESCPEDCPPTVEYNASGALSNFSAAYSAPAVLGVPADAMRLASVTLVYVSGGVTCDKRKSSLTKWGCITRVPVTDRIDVNIATVNRGYLGPPKDGTCGVSTVLEGWKMAGYGANSPAIVVPLADQRFAGTEITLWFSDNLFQSAMTYNDGTTVFNWTLTYLVECGDGVCTVSETVVSCPRDCAQCSAWSDSRDGCRGSTRNCAWCGHMCSGNGTCPRCEEIQDPDDCAESASNCSWRGCCVVAYDITATCPAYGSAAPSSGGISSESNIPEGVSGSIFSIISSNKVDQPPSEDESIGAPHASSSSSSSSTRESNSDSSPPADGGSTAKQVVSAGLIAGVVCGSCAAIALLPCCAVLVVFLSRRRKLREDKKSEFDGSAVSIKSYRTSGELSPREGPARYSNRSIDLSALAATTTEENNHRQGMFESNDSGGCGGGGAVVVGAAEPIHVKLYLQSSWSSSSASGGGIPPPVMTKLQGAEFRKFQQTFRQHYQMHHEDYNEKRIKRGLGPLAFVVKEALQVNNPVLEGWYQQRLSYMRDAQRRTEEETWEHTVFHGSSPENIDAIARNGLLRVGHPLNPSRSTDEGFFGDPRCGVYASRFVEYALQYSNCRVIAEDGATGPVPLDEGDTAKIAMFKALPGKSLRMSAYSGSIRPTPGYDSHSSPENLEWFFFDETSLCPVYIVQVKAIRNTRTGANDGL